MVEEDLMLHVGSMVGENVSPLKRKTTSSNQGCRLTMQQKDKTELF
jgi:hypothetical protein